MTGIPLIIVFVLAIALMIFMISVWKIHPFISIMLIALGFGLIGGIPLVNQLDADGEVEVNGIATVIGQGFSGTFTSIGIVIILGALIGLVLEKTGGAFQIADALVRVIGKKRPVLATQLMGWIVSIPVFCDSGFVILNPIRRALARRTGTSAVAMTVALSAGLYTSHVFIPPTPGPIAAASTLGIGDNLLVVIGLGLLVSIPSLIVSYFYALYIGKRIRTDEDDEIADDAMLEQAYDDLRTSYGKLPSVANSFLPIVVPILLMALGSIGSVFEWDGLLGDILGFFGTPIIALAAGVVFAVVTLVSVTRGKELYDITDETLRVVGPILFITAAGGVLGRVIASTDMVVFIEDNATSFSSIGLFLPVHHLCDPQDRSGLLDGCSRDHGRHCRPHTPGPRSRYSGGNRLGGHGHRGWCHDRVACKRLVLLGCHELHRHDTAAGLPHADNGHVAHGCHVDYLHLDPGTVHHLVTGTELVA